MRRLRQRNASLLVLASGELAVVVGAAGTAMVADLGDRRHVDRMVQSPVALEVHAVDRPTGAALVVGGGAVVAGEVVAVPEPGDVTDLADDGGGEYRADAVDVGQPGRCALDHGPDLGLDGGQLLVERHEVSELVSGETAAQPAHLVAGADTGEQRLGLHRCQRLGGATRDKTNQVPVQAIHAPCAEIDQLLAAEGVWGTKRSSALVLGVSV